MKQLVTLCCCAIIFYSCSSAVCANEWRHEEDAQHQRQHTQQHVPRSASPTSTQYQQHNTPHLQRSQQYVQRTEYRPRHVQQHRAAPYVHPTPRNIPHEYHHFVGREYRYWSAIEQARWRHGVWRNEFYMGRYGYWWIVGGSRYFYPAPMYPYPLVVSEVVVGMPDQPPIVVQQPAPVVTPRTQPQRPVWYYCTSQRGYHPYVISCPEGWLVVPEGSPNPPR